MVHDVDRVDTPFGIRTVAITDADGFLLNGKPYPIYGVNRHQDVKGKGWALAPADHDVDLALIREVGATAIRLAHYPQSDYLHDACDRMGMLLWDEIPLVNELTYSAAFNDNAELQLREMISQRYNHPSVAFWGLYNELLKRFEENALVLTRLKTVARELDASRLIVGATCKSGNPMNVVPDWNCWNTYPGWYSQNGKSMAETVQRGYGEIKRRVGISEYGAGANVTQHQEDESQPVKPGGQFHPEEYQAYCHEKDWASIQGDRELWGTFIWNMFDFTAANRNEGNVPGLNDKGLVTYDRTIRKDVFYFYKANWNPAPMLHLCGSRFPVRAVPTIVVKAYSNAKDVSLTVNGQVVGNGQTEPLHIFRWKDVHLVPGKNTVIATAVSGGQTMTETVEWTFDPAAAPPTKVP